jgi:hypothetical protein
MCGVTCTCWRRAYPRRALRKRGDPSWIIRWRRDKPAIGSGLVSRIMWQRAAAEVFSGERCRVEAWGEDLVVGGGWWRVGSGRPRRSGAILRIGPPQGRRRRGWLAGQLSGAEGRLRGGEEHSGVSCGQGDEPGAGPRGATGVSYGVIMVTQGQHSIRRRWGWGWGVKLIYYNVC